jgi:hypothetical protein
MPRPKAHPEQHLRAYRLWRTGKGHKEIVEVLENEFNSPVSERTVSQWIKGFKELNPATVDLDSPFEWHRMESYGLPWEASAYILRMWGLSLEGNLIEFETVLSDRSSRTPQSSPTIRQARWWWRVHQAAPDLGFSEVNILTNDFVVRELDHEILALPLEIADLQAFLAYRPWQGLPGDTIRYEAYREAMSQGRISPLKGGVNVAAKDFIADLMRIHPYSQEILDSYSCNPAFFFLKSREYTPTTSPIKFYAKEKRS